MVGLVVGPTTLDKGPALTLAALVRPFRLRVESSLASVHRLAG